MITRETARLIAELVASAFTAFRSTGHDGYTYSDCNRTYDFLYDNSFPAWLCNAAKTSCSTTSTRPLQEFIMKLHTGESQYPMTQEWSWPQREKIGQQYLRQLAEAILLYWSSQADRYLGSGVKGSIAKCRRRLELDGFVFRGTALLAPEEDAVDAREEAGVLEQLYKDLALKDRDTAIHHLRLSEEHYIAARWDDSIGNSRKFLECVLREVASRHSLLIQKKALSEATASRPVEVRDYLENTGLIESKEKKAVAAIYGLLSETGGHPYMAQNEQARLLRHLALTVSQFVMLRLRGCTKTGA